MKYQKQDFLAGEGWVAAMDQDSKPVNIHIASAMQCRSQCSETESNAHPDKWLMACNTSFMRITQESEEQMQRYYQAYIDNSSAVESQWDIALRL